MMNSATDLSAAWRQPALRLLRRIARSDLLMYALFFAWLVAWLDNCLGLPFHWDAVGYVSHHAKVIYDNHLVPFVFGDYDVGHPTLVFWLLAVVWRVFGISLLPSHLLMIGFAALLLLYTWKTCRLLGFPGAGLAATLLMSLIPMVASQSAQMNLDIPEAALFAAAVYYMARGRRPWRLAVCASLLLLTKLNAVFLLPPMIAYALARSWLRGGFQDGRAHLRALAPFCAPLLCLGAFLLLRFFVTGTRVAKFHSDHAALSLSLEAFRTRLPWFTDAIWRFGHAWAPAVLLGLGVLCALALWAFPRRREAFAPKAALTKSRAGFLLFAVTVILVFVVPHVMRTVYGPIPRHFLPLHPLFAVGAAWGIGTAWRLFRPMPVVAVLVLAVVCLYHWHPKYAEGVQCEPLRRALTFDAEAIGDGAGESNFQWVDYVKAVRKAGRFLDKQYDADAAFCAAYPDDAMLAHPCNGYVEKAREVFTLYSLEDYVEALSSGRASLYIRSSKANVSFTMDALRAAVSLRLARRTEHRDEWCEIYEPVEPGGAAGPDNEPGRVQPDR